ncbi:response regulator [Caulobacter segnis]
MRAGPALRLSRPNRARPRRRSTQARPLKLLVADDNEANRELIGALVRAMGHEVDVVTDGGAAVEAAASGAYDLILMDVRMPRMDGLAATRAIRDLAGRTAATPIIALTANVLPDQIALLYRASGHGRPRRQADQPARAAAEVWRCVSRGRRADDRAAPAERA